MLKSILPEYNWVYNYAIDDNWQIDIAAPERRIFVSGTAGTTGYQYMVKVVSITERIEIKERIKLF